MASLCLNVERVLYVESALILGLRRGYAHNYGTGKRYLITDPDGNTYTPESIVEFCREHELTPQNLRKVAKGTRKHHKGWKAVEIS